MRRTWLSTLRHLSQEVERSSINGQNKLELKVIETVPRMLHDHLFRTTAPSTASNTEYCIDLPKLHGQSVIEHFQIEGKRQADPYFALLDELAKLPLSKSLPSNLQKFPRPKKWLMKSGWTRYDHKDGSVTQVQYPLEDVFTFDVEVCVKEGLLPTLAVAFSEKAWYGWCSEYLVNEKKPTPYAKISDLIPLGGDRPRIAVGHNVGYDRVRSQEPYFKEATPLRFMDTMSMSLPMYGMADHQQRSYDQMDTDPELYEAINGKVRKAWRSEWQNGVTKNSLSAVFGFLFGKELNKDVRSNFVSQPISFFQDEREFQIAMNYCAEDNMATCMIYKEMWLEFNKRFPHPATLIGMLTMGNAYLPINKNWRMFYEDNTKRSDDIKNEGARALIKSAKLLSSQTENITDDLWMFPFADLPDVKGKEEKPWVYKLCTNKKAATLEIEDITAKDVVLKSDLVPCIFGMVYGPYPLYKLKEQGWGYLVPNSRNNASKQKSDTEEDTNENLLAVNCKKLYDFVEERKLISGDVISLPDKPDEKLNGANFYKLPHPDGKDKNVGSILSKGFYKELSSEILTPTRFHDAFNLLLTASKTTRFWTNYSDRFGSELAIWDDVKEKEPEYGCLAPAIVAAGTISRRSVHKLWVTLTNSSDDEIIGVSIKNMIQAPPGFRLVGADVDSQEQWLAGIFGDSSVANSLPIESRVPGLTSFSNMMLAGSKSDGTDLHTVVAKEFQIKRGRAKTLNYARLYGAGEANAVETLNKGGMNVEEAQSVAHKLFLRTKGLKCGWRWLLEECKPLLDEFIAGYEGESCVNVVSGRYLLPAYDSPLKKFTHEFETWVLAKMKDRELNSIIPLLYDPFDRIDTFFFGGYESDTFNFLENVIRQDVVRTPVLGCQLGNGLAPLPLGTPGRDDFANETKRSISNWVVQSSAVDFLHLLIVSMQWLCREYDINCRFVISIHDEVRYLCPEEEASRVGLALMLSNMYVRAYISHRVGLLQMPMSVAFFSQVDMDTVLRKETDTHFKNPDGSTVPDGTAWTINDLIKLTGGTLRKL